MDVTAAVKERKSIRAFDSKPVPKEILAEIMETALWSPSWGNTQPWGFTVVSGRPLAAIKKGGLECTMKGEKPQPELDVPAKWNEAQTARYRGLGAGLFQVLGIQREDKEKRNAYYQDMNDCFGAPHVIYLHFEKGFQQYVFMDGGIILQTIALLAVEKGLGTCFLAASVIYPKVVREFGKIPDD